MALTDAQRKAHDKYFKSNYQRLAVSYPRAYIEKVKAMATARGETLAGFVKKAIDSRIAENPQDHDSKPAETGP